MLFKINIWLDLIILYNNVVTKYCFYLSARIVFMYARQGGLHEKLLYR